MSEAGDYDPGPWRGHNFRDAYRAFDVHAGRSYAAAKSKRITPVSLIPKELVTQSTSPLVIVSDVTGSMGEWPKVMFSKLPYLELASRFGHQAGQIHILGDADQFGDQLAHAAFGAVDGGLDHGPSSRSRFIRSARVLS